MNEKNERRTNLSFVLSTPTSFLNLHNSELGRDLRRFEETIGMGQNGVHMLYSDKFLHILLSLELA
jgi:hypothetical protein